MITSSADDNGCKQLVAGNYDVLINDSSMSEAFKSVLTNYLEHFQHHEQELGQPNCGYVNEFRLLKELSRALKEDKANLQIGELDFNQKKNRYKDIIPFSHTRVILQSSQPGGTTTAGLETAEADDNCYINANYIRGPSGSPRAYIACQGPLPCTLVDFWRMIWECNVSVVIMACNEFESGKPKCELYWSDQIESSQIYGNIQVTLLRVRQLNSDFLIRKFSVKLLEPECDQQQADDKNNNNLSDNFQDLKSEYHDSNDQNQQQQAYIKSNSNHQRLANNCSPLSNNSSVTNYCPTLSGSQMQSGTSSESLNTASDATSATSTSASTHRNVHSSFAANQQQGQEQPRNQRAVLAERTICQFHYTTWPDHGVPDSVSPILELVRLVREVQPSEEKPLLVHCSAGCGRTGTICCIDYVWGLLRLGKLDEDFNLCRIISEMRQQRMAMVQTLEQYILCHRAVAALFIEQLQMIDSHLALRSIDVDYNGCSAIGADPAAGDHSRMDDKLGAGEEEDEEDSKSFESEQDLGPVFI